MIGRSEIDLAGLWSTMVSARNNGMDGSLLRSPLRANCTSQVSSRNSSQSRPQTLPSFVNTHSKVGAPCNICELEGEYGTITSMDALSTSPQTEVVAKGIRNTVGFDWTMDGSLVFSNNGADGLGECAYFLLIKAPLQKNDNPSVR